MIIVSKTLHFWKYGYQINTFQHQTSKPESKNCKQATKDIRPSLAIARISGVHSNFIVPWLLHKNKLGTLHCPKQKRQLQYFSRWNSFDSLDESIECCLSITPATVYSRQNHQIRIYNLLHPATPRGGDQAVLPTPRGRRLLHPIRVGGPDLWYQMALGDTTVEQSLVSSMWGTRGRECV